MVVPEHVVAPDDGQGQHQGEEEHQQGRGHEAEHRAGERRQAGAAATKHSWVQWDFTGKETIKTTWKIL